MQNRNFNLFLLSSIFGVLILIPELIMAQGNVFESDTHRFEEVTEGVWFVYGTGSIRTASNSMVLVGDNDTLVVDSHITPAAAKALLKSLSVISDKPVRYLINTHYHFDHAHGNQSFPDGVEIIGHEFTRTKLNGETGDVLKESTFVSFTESLPTKVADLERQAFEETDPNRKAELTESHRVERDYMDATKQVVPTPPNITLERKMTLFQKTDDGSREIQLLHFGRAHTGGDVVVFLPEEKVVFTGDMMLPGLAYMGDGHVNEWPKALDGLKALDFDIWLPGHGSIMRSREFMDYFQAYLKDLWRKTSQMHGKGVSADQAAQEIDMTNHSANIPQIKEPGVDPRAIRRIYELLDNQ
ncbi:MAG: MBL fold metallo-hydrolase [Verrucomicrobia bacterium]|nr:MBL fold metallo-hydrolase [Verrucomicrobiota bacterium]